MFAWTEKQRVGINEGLRFFVQPRLMKMTPEILEDLRQHVVGGAKLGEKSLEVLRQQDMIAWEGEIHRDLIPILSEMVCFHPSYGCYVRDYIKEARIKYGSAT